MLGTCYALKDMERLWGFRRQHPEALQGVSAEMVIAKSVLVQGVRLFFIRCWYYKAYFADGLGAFAGVASSIILISFSASVVPE